MPTHYVELDEEEMYYVEGGTTLFTIPAAAVSLGVAIVSGSCIYHAVKMTNY